MPVTRSQARKIIGQMAMEYGKAGKSRKSEIITSIVGLTGFVRSAVGRSLRLAGKAPESKRKAPKGKRGRTYGPDVVIALSKVWAVLDYPSGKRMAPFLPEIIASLERFGELRLAESTRGKLLTVSASSIDRILAPMRRAAQIKGRSGTRPGSLLKSQVPIRTFQEWNDAVPGFMEIDLVEHNGGTCRGDFMCTLDAVDIATRWTETQAVRNKAQKWVFDALVRIFSRLPFAILGIDSDNGSEFINAHLVRYCRENMITFTRSRPNKKNDSCFVEQKNWSVVRRTVGYSRYDSELQLRLINELYLRLRLYTNYFQPVMTLLSKHRTGAKQTRHYDVARTPYQRIMASSLISDEAKGRLTAEYLSLNPAELKRRIRFLQDSLRDTILLKESMDEALALLDPEGPQPDAAGLKLNPDGQIALSVAPQAS